MSRDIDAILALARSQNGQITTKDITTNGFRRENLSQMTAEGLLIRTARGRYRLPDASYDPYLTLQLSCSNAVFSYETALYHHGLIRDNEIISITVQQGYNATRLKHICPELKVHYVQPDFLELGLMTAESPAGNPIRLYNRERCLSDLIKHRSRISSLHYTQAIQNYFRSPDKDLRRLQEYANRYRIEDKVYHYMEFFM